MVGSLGLSCQYKRFLFCLGCSGRPSTKYLFSHRTLFQCLCPHRPAVLGCLLLVCVSGLTVKETGAFNTWPSQIHLILLTIIVRFDELLSKVDDEIVQESSETLFYSGLIYNIHFYTDKAHCSVNTVHCFISRDLFIPRGCSDLPILAEIL